MLNQEKVDLPQNKRLQSFYTVKGLFNTHETCTCFKNNLEEVHQLSLMECFKNREEQLSCKIQKTCPINIEITMQNYYGLFFPPFQHSRFYMDEKNAFLKTQATNRNFCNQDTKTYKITSCHKIIHFSIYKQAFWIIRDL